MTKPELCNCKECGEEFSPWINGRYMQRRFCQPCVVEKRRKTYMENTIKKLEKMEAARKRRDTELPDPKPSNPCKTNPIVTFAAEPEMASKIAAIATRERRTFEQQVFWLLDSVL